MDHLAQRETYVHTAVQMARLENAGEKDVDERREARGAGDRPQATEEGRRAEGPAEQAEQEEQEEQCQMSRRRRRSRRSSAR